MPAAPYWLTSDELACPHCDQGYAYETEVRCALCDEPLCGLCAARRQGRMLCPHCADGERGC